MKAKVVILPDGTAQIVVEEGEFPEASARLAQFVESLKLSGLKFSSLGAIEQHRHGPEHVHTDVSVKGS